MSNSLQMVPQQQHSHVPKFTSSLEQNSHEEGRKSMSVGNSFIGSISSSSHTKRRGGSHSLNDHVNHEATLVPEFGAWDVTDPRPGEGYTAIFSEIRKEKQIATCHIPSKTPSLNNCSNIQNQCGRPSSILSKMQYFCCLFSSESK